MSKLCILDPLNKFGFGNISHQPRVFAKKEITLNEHNVNVTI